MRNNSTEEKQSLSVSPNETKGAASFLGVESWKHAK